MPTPIDHLVLDRTGPANATIGIISLPLPRDGGSLALDHPATGMHPVAWWERNKTPRRAMAYIVDNAGVPEHLRLTNKAAPSTQPASPWTAQAHITLERLDYVPHKFNNIEALRGVPAKDCTTIE